MICRKEVPLHSGNGKGGFTADCFKETKLLSMSKAEFAERGEKKPEVVDS